MGEAKRRRKLLGENYGKVPNTGYLKRPTPIEELGSQNPILALMEIPESEMKNHPELGKKAVLELIELERHHGREINLPSDPEELDKFLTKIFDDWCNAQIVFPGGHKALEF